MNAAKLTVCAYPNVRRIDIETDRGRVLASLPFGREDVDAEAYAALFGAAPKLVDELNKAEALIEAARVLAIANGNASSERAFTEGLLSIRAALRGIERLP